MSWRNITVEQERLDFVMEALDPNTMITFTELCLKYNISPKTGYKWYHRFLREGEVGLRDQSRARLTHPKKISEEIERQIIAIRKQYPTWGPKKIHAIMAYRELAPPSESSIGSILKKQHLSKPRYFRRHVAMTAPLIDCNHPNDVWMYDFKGAFKTGDGNTCEPLTITDGYSRYLLRCAHLQRKTGDNVWEILKKAFLEYGLPLRIRSDNGPPFATVGIGRLSLLAINIIKAGVIPEWIEPGCPEENGRHERFHLTLKNETASPPAKTLLLQLKKMEQFSAYYNNERPHEALGQRPPKQVYKQSTRIWDGKLRSPEYSEEYEARKVQICGHTVWQGMVFFVSERLRGEYVGIKEISPGLMGVHYGPILLGRIDLNKGFKRI